ncbi:hypothetical protein Fot_11837 [Forsythia ovata]|uniref:Uncharacterized protein n=1 Tax=Forsythia ovata TaxID=205694 RepID=A0ABD1WL74_9LAMI
MGSGKMVCGDFPAPDYGKNGNTLYEWSKVDYIDNYYTSYFSTFTLDRVMNVMKIPLPMGYAYKRNRLNLTHGLTRLAIDQHVAEMLQDIGPTMTVNMYLIPPVLPHYLPWDYSILIDQHIPEPKSKKRK